MKVVRKLKGGSLSTANVIEYSTGLYVRKSTCRINNREHGLVRLFSQKNKQNHLSQIFPQYFLPILKTGLDRTTGDAFIELEYKEGYKNLFEVLNSDLSRSDVKKIFELVHQIVEELAKIKFKSRITTEALNLYFEEELIRPVEALREMNIHSVLENEYIIFENRKVKNLLFQDLRDIEVYYKNVDFGFETLTHGNLTLENILVSPDFNDIKLIDCYDENYISNKYNELSQLLQCTRAFYSSSVSSEKIISTNSISASFQASSGVILFNELLQEYLTSILKAEELILVELYLVSQFTRMLPFKVKSGDTLGAIYYIGLASSLYESLNKNDYCV